ncbi:hypothetical protein EJB05_53207, partial [Eragrostis curvula]
MGDVNESAPDGNSCLDFGVQRTSCQVWSLQMKFEQCEISLVDHNQVSFVVKLARDYIDARIAKALAVSTWKEKEKTETCTICLEDTSASKIHAVEGAREV